jgi:hypothetical protein
MDAEADATAGATTASALTTGNPSSSRPCLETAEGVVGVLRASCSTSSTGTTAAAIPSAAPGSSGALDYLIAEDCRQVIAGGWCTEMNEDPEATATSRSRASGRTSTTAGSAAAPCRPPAIHSIGTALAVSATPCASTAAARANATAPPARAGDGPPLASHDTPCGCSATQPAGTVGARGTRAT